MVKCKKLLALLCAIIFAASLSFSVSAEKVNIDSWNTDSKLFSVLDGTAESNSAVEYAFLRVKYDRPSNRIRLLFMLELSSFTDESNAGVTMSVNGDEKITLHLNGNAEYNEDKYYAEINSFSDPRTKTLYLEVTLGIKKGIPDTVKLEFNVYDTEGVASNTYCVDITESPADTTAASQSDVQEQENDKPQKTSKTAKTAKTKNTKVKTTKTKTTNKNKTQSADDDVQALANADGEYISQAVINQENPAPNTDNETVISENKVIAIVVALAFVTGGAAAGLANLLKKAKKRDGG